MPSLLASSMLASPDLRTGLSDRSEYMTLNMSCNFGVAEPKNELSLGQP